MNGGLPSEAKLQADVVRYEGVLSRHKAHRVHEEILNKHQMELNELRKNYPDEQELIAACDGRLRKVRSLLNSVNGSIDELKRQIEGLKRKYGPEQRDEALQEIAIIIVDERIMKLEGAVEELDKF